MIKLEFSEELIIYLGAYSCLFLFGAVALFAWWKSYQDYCWKQDVLKQLKRLRLEVYDIQELPVLDFNVKNTLNNYAIDWRHDSNG